jgi:hypothetical protein
MSYPVAKPLSFSYSLTERSKRSANSRTRVWNVSSTFETET